jgi:O-antigen/teichoic acid export membrane protein
VLKLLGNVTLARLLAPEDFGLAAIVMSVVTGIEALTDVGTKPALIRSHRTDDEWLDTAWTLGLLRSLVVTAAIACLAIPLAGFFEDERLAGMIAVTSLMSVLVGLSSITAITLVRDLEVKRLTIIELAAAIICYAVMLGWAWVAPSAWVLIAGALVSTGIFTVASWTWLAPRKLRLRWSVPVVRELLNFGKWVFLSSIAGFFIMQGDRIGVAKLVGITEAGVYAIGQTWAMSLAALFGMVLSRLYLPVVSSFYRAKEFQSPKVLSLRRTVIAALIVPFAFGAGFAEPLITFLYPQEYLEAGSIMQVLIVGAWFSTLEALYRDQLFAKGLPAWYSAAQALSIVAMGLALVVMATGGITALAFAYIFAGGAAVRGLTLLLAVERKTLRNTLPDLLLTGVFLAVTGVIATALAVPSLEASSLVTILVGFALLLPFGAGIAWWALKRVLTLAGDVGSDVPADLVLATKIA